MVFTVEPCESMAAGQVGFSAPIRKWKGIDVNAPLSVAPFNSKDFIASMTVIVDFQNKKKTTKDPFQTEEMMKEFLMQFASQVFSVGQPIIFQFKSMPLLLITIKELEIADLSALQSGKASKGKAAEIGISLPDTAITFEKGEGSALFLAGSAKGKMVRQSIINPDWDFSKMGIGGLDTQFNAIFRRAFASRVFPPEIMEQLGCWTRISGQHCSFKL